MLILRKFHSEPAPEARSKMNSRAWEGGMSHPPRGCLGMRTPERRVNGCQPQNHRSPPFWLPGNPLPFSSVYSSFPPSSPGKRAGLFCRWRRAQLRRLWVKWKEIRAGDLGFIYLNILFIFRERGRGEGEKYHCMVAPHVPPTGDLACNPGICPDWELNTRPFGSQA